MNFNQTIDKNHASFQCIATAKYFHSL